VLASAAALPAIAVGLGSVAAALGLGFSGFGAALGGDAEALADLAPAARDAVTAIRALGGEFDKLKTAVQGELFAGLDDEIRALAGVWLPLLQQRLPAVAAGLNDLFAGLAQGATSEGFLAGVDAALAHTATGLSGLGKAASPFLDAIGRVTGAFAPSLSRAGDAAAELAQRFDNFIRRAEATGALAGFVDSVGAALSDLGGMLKNLGGIVKAVFDASAYGPGLLGNLEAVTGAVADFLNSVRGQDALSGFFQAVRDAASALLPTVLALAAGVGTVLAPALADVAEGLGPGLETLAAGLVDALSRIDLSSVAEGLGGILTAAAPLLPILGDLVNIVANGLGAALVGLSDSAALVSEAIAAAFTPETLAGVSEAFLALGTAIADIAQRGAPLLADAVTAILPSLLELVPVLVDSLIPALQSWIGAQMSLLEAVLPLIPPLLGLVAAVAPLVGLVLQLGAAVMEHAYGALSTLLGPVVEIAGWLAGGLAAAISLVTAWFRDHFVPAAQSAWSWLSEQLAPAVERLSQFYQDKLAPAIAAVAAWFRDEFVPAAQAAWSWIQEYVAPAASALAGVLAGPLVASIASTVSGLVNLIVFLVDVAEAAWDVAADVVNAWRQVQAVPGLVLSFLSGLPGMMLSLGEDMIAGIVQGIHNMGPQIGDTLMGYAEDAWNSATSFFGVKSPSTRFAWLSEQLGLGWIRGLDRIGPAMVEASSGVAVAAYDPWSTGPGRSSFPDAGPAEQPLGVSVSVRLGERELKSIVVDAVKSAPDSVARSVDHGRRLNNLRS
ncbi:MAG: phage tail protein, partial [Stackebrandtia sp.]